MGFQATARDKEGKRGEGGTRVSKKKKRKKK
jgi:hypothetical protein